jgi:hypothetical protein
MPKYPFEASYDEIAADFDTYIDTVFSTLQSSFLVLPKGPGFVEYAAFQEAYEVLKRHTGGFARIEPAVAWAALEEDALVLLVLRSILGFTPPELAYLAAQETSLDIPQNFARTLDRRVREDRQLFSRIEDEGKKRVEALVVREDRKPFSRIEEEAKKRVEALVSTACNLINAGTPKVPKDLIHRLNKADTKAGKESLRPLAQTGLPYAMLLYERYLGRPFASHRDAVSELVGDVMENAVEDQLNAAGVTYRKTKRAEKIEGFDQAPDFIIPDEWNPIAVIEAKITEDDGTARDKVTRIQHLATISRGREIRKLGPFEVIACIDGRGFGVRREDMRKLLESTRGKIFTTKTVEHLVDETSIARLRTK